MRARLRARRSAERTLGVVAFAEHHDRELVGLASAEDRDALEVRREPLRSGRAATAAVGIRGRAAAREPGPPWRAPPPPRATAVARRRRACSTTKATPSAPANTSDGRQRGRRSRRVQRRPRGPGQREQQGDRRAAARGERRWRCRGPPARSSAARPPSARHKAAPSSRVP